MKIRNFPYTFIRYRLQLLNLLAADKPLAVYDGGLNEEYTVYTQDFKTLTEANSKPLPSVLHYFVPHGALVGCYRVSCAEKACHRSGC